MAEGHHQEEQYRLLGEIEDRDDIRGIARAVALGVGDAPTLLSLGADETFDIAVQAVANQAEHYRAKLDSDLARKIIEHLGSALGG